MLWSGTCLGIWFVLTGCSIGLLRNPKNAPTNVSGTETPNHSDSKANNVEKGIAADESSYHNTKFITKK